LAGATECLDGSLSLHHVAKALLGRAGKLSPKQRAIDIALVQPDDGINGVA